VEAGSRDLAPAAGAVRGASTLWLHTTAVFVAAALLFVVEPMVAKMLLPSFGGTPAVWAISLVFFQAVLLAGYAFAHLSFRLLPVRRQALAQLGLLLLPLLLLPIALPGNAAPAAGADPSLWLLWILVLMVGLPFFAVTTASPVLQRWFSETGAAGSRDPYFLYAAGNAGSLIGLLAYPTLIEPTLTLHQQARLWTAGYAIFVVLAGLCARRMLAGEGVAATGTVTEAAPAIPKTTRLRWIALAALPSALMLGATTYLTTDVAAVPLLWVIPLALYLLSFVAAFARRPPLSPSAVSRAAVVSSLAVAASLLLAALVPTLQLPIWVLVTVHGANLFFIALLVHGRLAAERPAPERLTEFYLLLSTGGVLGGILAALVAPAVFSSVVEYPLALVLCLVLRPGSLRPPKAGPLRRNADLLLPFAVLVGTLFLAKSTAGPLRLVPLLAVAAVACFAARPLRFALGVGALLLITSVPPASLVSDRTFFGVIRVEQDGSKHVLVHGTTVHGVESFARGQRGEPLSYYTRQGPLGQLFRAYEGRIARVAAVGLGSGALAAYGRPGDSFTFYEIDPAVARIAVDPRYFSFVHDSRASVRIVIGDGRLELQGAPDRSYDLIVLDAFSSDSVPVHLLTREAAQLYLRKLRPGGLLAYHVSSRFFDLEPVVGGVGGAPGAPARGANHPPPPPARPPRPASAACTRCTGPRLRRRGSGRRTRSGSCWHGALPRSRPCPDQDAGGRCGPASPGRISSRTSSASSAGCTSTF
jgi:SAM-dependent methyltransferase